MKTTKTYHFVYDLLLENKPEFVNGLTEEQKETIQHADDFEFFRYELIDNHVTVFESWNSDTIIGFDSLENIVQNTIEFLEAYE